MTRHEIQILRAVGMAQAAVAAKTNVSVRSVRRIEGEVPVIDSDTPALIRPRWTAENRPVVDRAKPASETRPKQESSTAFERDRASPSCWWPRRSGGVPVALEARAPAARPTREYVRVRFWVSTEGSGPMVWAARPSPRPGRRRSPAGYATTASCRAASSSAGCARSTAIVAARARSTN